MAPRPPGPDGVEAIPDRLAESYDRLPLALEQLLVEAQRVGCAGVREWASLAMLDAIDFAEELEMLWDDEAERRRGAVKEGFGDLVRQRGLGSNELADGFGGTRPAVRRDAFPSSVVKQELTSVGPLGGTRAVVLDPGGAEGVEVRLASSPVERSKAKVRRGVRDFEFQPPIPR